MKKEDITILTNEERSSGIVVGNVLSKKYSFGKFTKKEDKYLFQKYLIPSDIDSAYENTMEFNSFDDIADYIVDHQEGFLK